MSMASRPDRRRALLAALIGVLVVAAVGHAVYWYLPRERATIADPADGPARLLASRRWPLRAWLAFPRHNLGALASSVPDAEGWLAAIARLAGLREPGRLPRFGPFAVPPARELAIASDLQGKDVAIVARVEPVLAWAARLAGKLAGNPWLGGGVVDSGGRRLTVSWRGTLWRVSSDPTALDELPAAVGAPPALARFELERSAEELPAGSYALRRAAGGELELVGGTPGPPGRPTGTDDLPALCIALRPTGPRGAWILLPSGKAAADLPEAAVVVPVSGPGFRLPGESLFHALGIQTLEGAAGDWRFRALDPAGLERAAAVGRLLPGLDRLALGIWVEPRAALDRLAPLDTALRALPLLPEREMRRWRDVQLVLRGLRGVREVELAIFHDPAGLRLRVVPGTAPD